jgi:FMN phosphatase YigB (HAD superfamily)
LIQKESTSVRAETDSETEHSLKKVDLRRFKAILFDLDNTLTDTNGYALRASAWVLSQCNNDHDDILEPFLTTLVQNYRLEIEKIVNGQDYISTYYCVKNALQITINEMNLEASSSLPDEGAQLFKQLHFELSRPMPSVKKLLEKLVSTGIKIGVVTNTFEGHAKLILERHNLLDIFDLVSDSSDFKSYKPMCEPFQYALNILNVNVNESIYVGDEYHADVIGPSTVGMASIWLNLRKFDLEERMKRYGQNVVPYLIIDTVSELQSYL